MKKLLSSMVLLFTYFIFWGCASTPPESNEETETVVTEETPVEVEEETEEEVSDAMEESEVVEAPETTTLDESSDQEIGESSPVRTDTETESTQTSLTDEVSTDIDTTPEPSETQERMSSPQTETRPDPGRTSDPDTSSPVAQRTTYDAEIVFADGDVMIHSAGNIFEAYIGDPLEPFDTVETGSDGYAELEISAPGLEKALIKVSPGTSFYYEGSFSPENSSTTVHVLAGRAQFEVDNLAAGSGFMSRSRDSVLGVRGTQYSLSISPRENVLITCLEGEVVLEADSGSLSVSPGRVVIQDNNGDLETRDLAPVEVTNFEDQWFNVSEVSGFLARAGEFTGFYIGSYEDREPEFNRYFAELADKIDIIDRWDRILAQGTTLSMVEVARDKRQIGPILLNLKRVLFFLERDVAQILASQRILESRGMAGTLLPNGESAGSFFTGRSMELENFQKRMSVVRWAMRVFEQIDPSSPMSDFFTGGESNDTDGSFFDNTDGFFD